MRAVRLVVLLALVPLALLTLRQTQRVTACAGDYDPRTRECDTRSFQAPPPFQMGRRDVLVGAVLVALAGAATAVVLRRLAIRRRTLHDPSR
jgi:hypothetical protein